MALDDDVVVLPCNSKFAIQHAQLLPLGDHTFDQDTLVHCVCVLQELRQIIARHPSDPESQQRRSGGVYLCVLVMSQWPIIFRPGRTDSDLSSLDPLRPCLVGAQAQIV